MQGHGGLYIVSQGGQRSESEKKMWWWKQGGEGGERERWKERYWECLNPGFEKRRKGP